MSERGFFSASNDIKTLDGKHFFRVRVILWTSRLTYQGSLCPSPMGILSMFIDTEINFAQLPHTTYCTTT